MSVMGTFISKSQSLRESFKESPRPGARGAVAFVVSLKFETRLCIVFRKNRKESFKCAELYLNFKKPGDLLD